MAVPRVTAILSDMLHEDSLMSWSNYIGLVKHQKYKDVLDQAAEKGTYVHEGIEHYLQDGVELNSADIPYEYKEHVMNAWNSFLLWWSIVSKNDAQVLAQEMPLVCEFYGGTIDILLKINGKIYLMDFKTSNHLSYKYCLQLAAYRYLLRTLQGIEVDGIGIIRLEKQSINFEEMILDMSNPEDLQFMNDCETCFHSLVIGYYYRKQIEAQFKERMKVKDEL